MIRNRDREGQKARKLVGNGEHGLSYQESEKEKGDREKRGLEGGEEKRGKKGPKIGQKQVGREVGVIVVIKKTIRETGELTLNSQKQAQQRDGYSRGYLLRAVRRLTLR